LAIQENPGKKVELVLDLWRDSIVDNEYFLPYLNADASNRNHQAALYYLGVPIFRKSSGSVDYLHAEQVPFQRIRDIARMGFIRAGNFMPPEMRKHGGRREEVNEYYMGNYLEVAAMNLKDQAATSGQNLRIRASLSIDGVKSSKYTVQKPCYFMMGDNRDNSSDSRYFGLLSRNNVKAKAFIIYFSFENENSSFRLGNPFTWYSIPFKIRWTRLGKLIQ